MPEEVGKGFLVFYSIKNFQTNIVLEILALTEKVRGWGEQTFGARAMGTISKI